MPANANAALAHRQRTGQFARGWERCDNCRCHRRNDCPGRQIGDPDPMEQIRDAILSAPPSDSLPSLQAMGLDMARGRDTTSIAVHTINPDTGEEEITRVQTNENHGHAIRADGSLWAFGHNNYGQLNTGGLASADLRQVEERVMARVHDSVVLHGTPEDGETAESILQQFRDAYPQVQEFWDGVRERIEGFARGGTVTGRISASDPQPSSILRVSRNQQTLGRTQIGGRLIIQETREALEERISPEGVERMRQELFGTPAPEEPRTFMGMPVRESDAVPPGQVVTIDVDGDASMLASPEMAARIRQAVNIATRRTAERVGRQALGIRDSDFDWDATEELGEPEPIEPKPAEVAPRRPRRFHDPDA